MQIIIKGISEIKPYENNPRNNDSAVDAVAASIREFGWQQPAKTLLMMGVTQVALKVLYEIIILPATKAVTRKTLEMEAKTCHAASTPTASQI